ncbi:hypothetical protein [Taibaiella koreensis]|uniref:hypothetical protein n=1 Tax=Taibaiella koreensis TaxID=1268548 RepID=UPI000E59ABE5|nr:hypothetical protein [Taibaiella koreensis]
MRKYYLFAACLLCLSLSTQAQEPDLKPLELTASPAYILLGVQPTNIQRPSTPRDFAASLQSAAVNGVLQPNFALEVNPFNWNKKAAGNQYSFIANDYFSTDILPAIKKNFAISLATSSTDTVKFGDLNKGTGLGYGLRVTLLPGTVNKRTTEDLHAWATAETKQLALSLVDNLLNSPSFTYEDVQRAFDMAAAHTAERKDIPDAMKAGLQNDLLSLKGKVAALKDTAALQSWLATEEPALDSMKAVALDRINKRRTPFAREGFILEAAYSGVIVLQNNNWDNAVYAKTGIWITPSYRLDLSNDKDLKLVQSLDFLGILRYIWNEHRVDPGNYLDFGAKAQFNRNDWNIGLEGVFRHASEIPLTQSSHWTYSWAANFSYTLQDNITLRLSFGSQFDGNTRVYTKPNEILAIGGISFGLLGKGK